MATSKQKMDQKGEMKDTADRVAAGVGGCAPAAPREGEGLDPLP